MVPIEKINILKVGTYKIKNENIFNDLVNDNSKFRHPKYSINHDDYLSIDEYEHLQVILTRPHSALFEGVDNTCDRIETYIEIFGINIPMNWYTLNIIQDNEMLYDYSTVDKMFILQFSNVENLMILINDAIKKDFSIITLDIKNYSVAMQRNTSIYTTDKITKNKGFFE